MEAISATQALRLTSPYVQMAGQSGVMPQLQNQGLMQYPQMGYQQLQQYQFQQPQQQMQAIPAEYLNAANLQMLASQGYYVQAPSALTTSLAQSQQHQFQLQQQQLQQYVQQAGDEVSSPGQVVPGAKRSYSEISAPLLQYSGMLAAVQQQPAVVASQQMMNGSPVDSNDPKKCKLEPGCMSPGSAGSNDPSKVLHFRNVPAEVSESEIIMLGLPFGVPSNVLLNKKGHQAFLEMPDEDVALRAVEFYAQNPKQSQLRGQPVFIQFSNHRELKTENNPSGQAALKATQILKQSAPEDATKCVLRVIIENYLYPVTIDMLRAIFSKYGDVKKIVIFSKNNTFQALIQMGDPISALTGKMHLDGQNVYHGCCTLRVDFSKLTSLNIRYNNEKSFDYTNPTLPAGEPITSESLPQIAFEAMQGLLSPAMLGGMAGMGQLQQISQMQQLMNAGGQVVNIGGQPIATAQPQALPMQMHSLQALQQQQAQQQQQQAVQQQQNALQLPLTLAQLSSVLHVSNLDEVKVTPDILFTLFGVYGNVLRVKIMFNKRDTALVQYSDPQAANIAMGYLNSVSLYGKPLHIVLSKNSNVQLPKEGQPDAGLTKDFTDSPLHRFKKPGSKNFNNIYPPSNVLHLSNIPAGVDEAYLTHLFADKSLAMAKFKFFPKDHKMALVEADSVDTAIQALVELHNYQLSESSHLRVSFSKATIS